MTACYVGTGAHDNFPCLIQLNSCDVLMLRKYSLFHITERLVKQELVWRSDYLSRASCVSVHCDACIDDLLEALNALILLFFSLNADLESDFEGAVRRRPLDVEKSSFDDVDITWHSHMQRWCRRAQMSTQSSNAESLHSNSLVQSVRSHKLYTLQTSTDPLVQLVIAYHARTIAYTDHASAAIEF